MSKMASLTWKDVFDCKKMYGHITDCETAAHLAGYKYFAWNGRVIKVGDDSYIFTDCPLTPPDDVDDVERSAALDRLFDRVLNYAGALELSTDGETRDKLQIERNGSWDPIARVWRWNSWSVSIGLHRCVNSDLRLATEELLGDLIQAAKENRAKLDRVLQNIPWPSDDEGIPAPSDEDDDSEA